ncbi:MAG: hypothetical protein MJZ17_04955 [Bacteroidales bacterium]|nr:hypothetical protein [Bacteroidales bacterium]
MGSIKDAMSRKRPPMLLVAMTAVTLSGLSFLEGVIVASGCFSCMEIVLLSILLGLGAGVLVVILLDVYRASSAHSFHKNG